MAEKLKGVLAELWVLVVVDKLGLAENKGVFVEKLELEVAFLGENKGVLAGKLEGVLAELWILVVADRLGLEVAL